MGLMSAQPDNSSRVPYGCLSPRTTGSSALPVLMNCRSRGLEDVVAALPKELTVSGVTKQSDIPSDPEQVCSDGSPGVIRHLYFHPCTCGEKASKHEMEFVQEDLHGNKRHLIATSRPGRLDDTSHSSTWEVLAKNNREPSAHGGPDAPPQSLDGMCPRWA